MLRLAELGYPLLTEVMLLKIPQGRRKLTRFKSLSEIVIFSLRQHMFKSPEAVTDKSLK